MTQIALLRSLNDKYTVAGPSCVYILTSFRATQRASCVIYLALSFLTVLTIFSDFACCVDFLEETPP